MRGILALLLLAPVAAAQPEVIDWVTASVAPFETPIPPLQGAASTRVDVSASCLLADPAGQVTVAYAVVDRPSWATVVVSPSTDAKNVQSCEEGRLAFEGTLVVTVTDQAPAFAPATIALEVTAGGGGREERAQASVDVSSDYYAILDVQLAAPQAVIRPGGHHDFVVRVSNFGNGATRVEPTLTRADEPLQVSLPSTITLGSKQQGARDIAADLVFRVAAPDEGGFVNRVGSVDVRLQGFYALDDSRGADASTVSFLVTIRTGATQDGEPERALPLGALAPLAAIGLAARALRRARP